jgi:hypothetical protein
MPINKARQFADRLRIRLAEIAIEPAELDRRLGWRSGRVAQLISRGGNLRMAELLAILEAAGLDERSFFASFYGLDAEHPAPRRSEIPYSSGEISEEDSGEFPPAEEVIGLIRALVGSGPALPASRHARKGSGSPDQPDLGPFPKTPPED